MTDNKPTNDTLHRIGKKMPYTVPDGFFRHLDEQIIAATQAEMTRTARMRRNIWRAITGATMAAAASVAIVLSVGNFSQSPIIASSLTPEQAFDNLSSTDQEFLLDTYRTELLAEY